MQKFNPHERPPFICPKEYCYNWEKTPYSPEPYCTARRKCTRMYPDGRIDALEPNEKKLTEGGLPWFYFTSDTNIVDVMKETYRKGFVEYWGIDYQNWGKEELKEIPAENNISAKENLYSNHIENIKHDFSEY